MTIPKQQVDPLSHLPTGFRTAGLLFGTAAVESPPSFLEKLGGGRGDLVRSIFGLFGSARPAAQTGGAAVGRALVPATRALAAPAARTGTALAPTARAVAQEAQAAGAAGAAFRRPAHQPYWTPPAGAPPRPVGPRLVNPSAGGGAGAGGGGGGGGGPPVYHAYAADHLRLPPPPTVPPSMWNRMGGGGGAARLAFGGLGGWSEGEEMGLPGWTRPLSAAAGAAAFHHGAHRALTGGPGRRAALSTPVGMMRGRLLGASTGFLADQGALLAGQGRPNPETGRMEAPGFQRAFSNLGMYAGGARGAGQSLRGLGQLGVPHVEGMGRTLGNFGRGAEQAIGWAPRRLMDFATGGRRVQLPGAEGAAGGVRRVVGAGQMAPMSPAQHWGRALGMGGLAAAGIPLGQRAFVETAAQQGVEAAARLGRPLVEGSADVMAQRLGQHAHNFMGQHGMLNQQGQFSPIGNLGPELRQQLGQVTHPFLQMLGFRHPEQLSGGQQLAGAAGPVMAGAGLLSGNPMLAGVGAGMYAWPHFAHMGGGGGDGAGPQQPGQQQFTGLDRNEVAHQNRQQQAQRPFSSAAPTGQGWS